MGEIFEEGHLYLAEYDNYSRYKGITVMCGTDAIRARCVRRTACFVTFEVMRNDCDNVLLTKRTKIVQGDGTEFAYLKDNGQYKDFYIRSEQEILSEGVA